MCQCVSSQSCRSWLRLLLVVVVLMVACCGAEWVGMPQDTSQRLGLNATFNCSSDTDDGANVAWLKVDDVTGTTSLLFFNTDPWHVNVTRRMRADALPGGGVALTLTSLERSDDGRYQCSISNSKLSHTVRLTVLVNPGEPQLSVDTAEGDMREGVSVQLTCTSQGGNPPPSVTWYRNGSPLSPSAAVTTVTPPAVKFGATVGTLTWTLTAGDHLANFSCSVSTDVISESRVYSPLVRYLVQYAPIITITSDNISLSSAVPLIVVENSTLTLQCRVDAYPPVDSAAVNWYKDAVVAVARRSTLSVDRVSASDAATYTCSAYNFAERNASIQLIVHYAPRLRVVAAATAGGSGSVRMSTDGSVSVRENTGVNLTCEVDAVPAPGTSALRWYSNNSLIHTGQYYVISTVRRRDAGNYRCQTSNTLTPSHGSSQTAVGHAAFRLVVLYVASGTNVTGPHTVVMGDDVTLHCFVTDLGVPASVLSWSKLDDVNRFPSDSTLRLAAVDLSHIGNYSCTPRNEVGAGQSASIYLDVIDSSMAARASGCFPGDATVRLATGQMKTMDSLAVGDRVMTYDADTEQLHYDRVVSFLHRTPFTAVSTQYLTIETELAYRLTLTPGHLIYAGSGATVASEPTTHVQPIFAGHLHTGSYVIVNASGHVGRERVVRVSWSRDSAAGVYAPITERGTIVVDDVIVSCYAEFASHAAAHASMAPLRYVYHAGQLLTDWMTMTLRLQQQPRCAGADDGVHWYAELLRTLAKTVVPQRYWWSPAA